MLPWLDIFVYLFLSMQHKRHLQHPIKASLSHFIMTRPLTLNYHDKAKTSLRNLGLRIESRNGANLLLPYLCLTQRKRHRQFRLKVWFSYKSFVCLCNDPFFPLAKGTGCNVKSATDCSPKSSGCTLLCHRYVHDPILTLSSHSETSFKSLFDCRWWIVAAPSTTDRRSETTCSVSARYHSCKAFIDAL
jgi:hypothetical protein